MALLKVGALVIKQLTKPLAKRAKTHAKSSPFFAAQCIRVGNAVNVVTHRMNVTLLGGGCSKKTTRGCSRCGQRRRGAE